MLFEQYQLLIRSSFDPIFFFKTTIQSVEDKVNPVNLTNPIVYSMQYKDTRGPWTATHALIKVDEIGQN